MSAHVSDTMFTAFKTVPSPVSDKRADACEDLLADIYKIGEAWSAQAGGFGGFHVMGRSGRFLARWGGHSGPTGEGACIADALLALASKMAKDLSDWSREDDEDLTGVLAASIAALKLGGV